MAIPDCQRGTSTTLFVSPILVGIIIIAAALASFEVWWINQPSPSSTDSTTYLDINSATVSELTSLLGVDESMAARIVAERPYNQIDDLVQRNIVAEATYDKIKDQIVAKQK